MPSVQRKLARLPESFVLLIHMRRKMMYKKRLHAWGVFKNLRAESRDNLVRIAEESYQTGTRLPPVDHTGTAIPWDRVKRHCQAQHHSTGLWQKVRLPPKQHREMQLDRRERLRSARAAAEQRIAFSRNVSVRYRPQSPTYEVDVILLQIRAFQSWRETTMTIKWFSNVSGNDGGSDTTLIDFAREDAALNFVNGCLQGLHL